MYTFTTMKSLTLLCIAIAYVLLELPQSNALRIMTSKWSHILGSRKMVFSLQGKNIRDEEASLSGAKKREKGKKKSNKELPAGNIANPTESIASQPTAISSGQEEMSKGMSMQVTEEENPQPIAADDASQGEMTEEEAEFEMIDTLRDEGVLVNSKFKPFRVPRNDPTAQSQVPPEVVFFGEPRRPPPVEAARDNKYHGPLLAWARHASVIPQTSQERLESVFPRGRLDSQAMKYRLDSKDLTFKNIIGTIYMRNINF